MKKRRKDYQGGTKTCAHCGGVIERATGISAHQWRAQRFCSRSCVKRGTYDYESFRARFHERYIPEPNSGCWIWTGTESSHGYGQMSVRGAQMLMHRLSYQLHHGAIPKDLYVLHRCDNRLCVNPDHLYAGDVAQNARDAVERLRFAYGERNNSAKLTAFIVKKIRASAESDTELSREYGVSRTAIKNARLGATWGHVR